MKVAPPHRRPGERRGLATFAFEVTYAFRSRTKPLLLNSVQVIGLHAAIYLLQQYMDTLNPEPGG
jgi:hypothetical protein